MKTSLKKLIILICIFVILILSILIMQQEEKKVNQEENETSPLTSSYVIDMPCASISLIEVQNQNGSYTVTALDDGEYEVSNIDAALVNQDYINLLISECCKLPYEEIISSKSDNLALYQLDKPEAYVTIHYQNKQQITLLVGAQEPVSKGRYVMIAGDETVYLISRGKTVRFVMNPSKFINYIIIEPNSSVALLNHLQNISFSGTQFPETLTIKGVASGDETLELAALSFGATSHLMYIGKATTQAFEVNRTTLMDIADSLFGLISEGVVSYNCDDETLDDFGFNTPYEKLSFDYMNGDDKEVTHHVLTVVKKDEQYYVTLDNQRVIYQIANVSFLNATYETLISSWYYSAFITDLQSVKCSYNDEVFTYQLEAQEEKNIRYTLNKKEISKEEFSVFYKQLSSLHKATIEEMPVLLDNLEYQGEIKFSYNSKKPSDVLSFYKNGSRYLYVAENGEVRSSVLFFDVNELFQTINDSL